MSIKYRTHAYFSDFRCLGADCEDTCCKDWEVKLDREHYDILKDVMHKDQTKKQLFDENIILNNRTISGDHDYAFITMGENGKCAMLDDEGLCILHRDHGPEVLGNVCTMFPRIISRCNNIVELSGSLSCPEVVRHCINATTPMKMKSFKTADLPRSKNYPIQREIFSDNDDFYLVNFPKVRETFLNIIGNEKYNLESRLYTLLSLSHRISAYYHRGCANPSTQQFDQVLKEFASDDDLHARLGKFIHDYEVDSPVGIIVAHSIMAIKLQQEPAENISQLYTDILGAFPEDTDYVESIFNYLPQVRQCLPDETNEIIEKAITRYILNCIYREWFISMPDSFTYMQMLLVRVMILRILIYLTLGVGNITEKEEVEKQLVYVMYNFARNIDQNLEFLKIVYNALSEQAMISFDFSPAFIRIFSH